MKSFRLLLLPLVLLLWHSADACSSAVVARKLSAEGEVLIWKHRDQTNVTDCRIVYFDDGKYAYTALANSYVSVGSSTLAGVNEVGFGYISTATSNLHRSPVTQIERYNGKYGLMCRALREGRTVDEFEQLLKTHGRYASFESNVGVGDAEGGAAYFEDYLS